MSLGIPQIEISEIADRGLDLLEDAGCLVVNSVTNNEERTALREQLSGVMANTPVKTSDDTGQFYPGHTKRGTSLVAHSDIARNFVMHPMATTVCDHFLQPNCGPNCRYQLHVSAAIEIGPGARKQVLHREEDAFDYFPVPRPNMIVATMWAISDFTADNGATLLVPGSHKWSAERRPEPCEVLSAEMPAGSVLFWLGGTLHGGGANLTEDWRYGVILTYSLGWLRQEENQSLATPPDIARQFSSELQDMLGNTANGALGFHFYRGSDSESDLSMDEAATAQT
ncbi:MAG: mitomycin antibiotic biosynthesis protein [Pseudomonadales bacterium]|nr:mitomycin antibiotic biosynthesis protein [Pseudomonadales bacterium]